MSARLRSRITNSTGSTLIEVLIATTVVVLVLVAITSLMTLVTRNQRASSGAQQATKYSQQPIEWMRQLRDTLGWKTFYDTVNSQGASVVHCVKSIPANVDAASYLALPTTACASTDYVTYDSTVGHTDPGNFVRQVTTRVINTERIEVNVSVSWEDGAKVLDSSASAIFQKWR